MSRQINYEYSEYMPHEYYYDNGIYGNNLPLELYSAEIESRNREFSRRLQKIK